MPERTQGSTLLEEMLQEQESKATSACTIRKIFEALSEEDAAALQQAFDTPGVDGTVIAEILKRRQFKVSSHTVQRHRRGVCSCE